MLIPLIFRVSWPLWAIGLHGIALRVEESFWGWLPTLGFTIRSCAFVGWESETRTVSDTELDMLTPQA